MEWHKEDDGVEWREENIPHKKLFSCLIRVPLAPGITKKTGLTVEFDTLRVKVHVKGQPLAACLEQELSTPIKKDDSTWTIETDDGQRFLMLELATREPGSEAWQKLFKDAEVVVEKEPEDDTPPGQPKFDMEQIKRQREKVSVDDETALPRFDRRLLAFRRGRMPASRSRASRR